MNSKKFISILIAILIVSILPVSGAAAKAPREYFSATAQAIGLLDPGTTVVHDDHVLVRGMKQVYMACWTFEKPTRTECHREVVEVNVVLSLVDMTGTMQGTFVYLDDEDNVIWEGIFYGSRKIVDGHMVSTVNDIGRGVGINEGLLFQYTLQAFDIWDPSQPALFEGTGFVQATSK